MKNILRNGSNRKYIMFYVASFPFIVPSKISLFSNLEQIFFFSTIIQDYVFILLFQYIELITRFRMIERIRDESVERLLKLRIGEPSTSFADSEEDLFDEDDEEFVEVCV